MRERYSEFCDKQLVPLHFQPWWLDAVCTAGAWDAAVVTGGDGRVRGVWPWYQARRMGIRVIVQPPFTAYGGPWLASTLSKDTSEYRIYPQLLDQLPRVAFFRQNFHPECANWMPLYHAGFHETLRYTYRFCPVPDDPASGYAPALRYDLRRAGQRLHILRSDLEIETMWRLNALSWRRQGKRQPYPEAVFRRLDAALGLRDRRALWLAFESAGGPALAALYLTFDSRSAGVLLSGQSPRGRQCAALHQLFHEAILFAGDQGLHFDFEGSMAPGIERAFRAYGARLTGYHQLWRWY